MATGTARKSRLRTLLLLEPMDGLEKELLAALLRFGVDGALPTTPREAGLSRERLAAFVDRVEAHRLGGVLAHLIRRRGFLAGPLESAGLLPGLEESWAAREQRLRDLHEEADRVRSLLAGHGIECHLLKGIFMARRCYPEPSMREMSDVDLLLPTAAVERAFEILLDAGLEVVEEQERHGPSKRLHGDQVIRPETGVVVELHHQVARGLSLEFLRRQQPGAAPPGAEELAPHVHLAHRLLDVAKDGYVRVGLLPYLDLLRLARTFGGALDVEAAWRLLEALGLSGFAAATLWHLERICAEAGLKAPDLSARTRRRPLLLKLSNHFYAREDALWRLRYTPRWQRRVLRAVLGAVS